jgi:hypothetical protein
LEKDRDRRYQSATALEEDIDRYLAGGFTLAGHLAGQIREGFGTAESLIIGGCCLAFGVLLSAVVNIGITLNRIEKRLKGSTDDETETLSN